MEERNLELSDYFVSLRKRKKVIFSIVSAIMCVFILVAFLSPSIYRSSATILIEQQEIPRTLVMSTVTSYAAERIQTIQALVMSRSNLSVIIEKFNLYESRRKYETSDAIISRMRDDTILDVVSADVVDPSTGRPSSATIAFSLSYDGESPPQVQKVVSELTTLYLNKNLESRISRASETSAFFSEESERISRIITELEEKIAEFKQNNAKMLPQVQPMNLQVLQRLESDITSMNTNLLILEDRKFYLEGRLNQIQPDNPLVLSVSTRLKILESEYASAASRYSKSHPDVIALKNEIDALRSGAGDNVSNLIKELKALEAKIGELSGKYTQEHPDIVALNAKIATLKKQLIVAKSEKGDEVDLDLLGSPDNPAYITLKAQLEGALSEIDSLKKQKDDYLQKQIELERVMLVAPQVEREYLVLQRDYENALRRNQEIKEKQRSADISKQLEAERKGERFTLIDPAMLPEEPISPNRPAILLLGLIFSLSVAIGFVLISDSLSGTIRGSKGIEAVLGMMPLSVVPYQLNMADVEYNRKINKRLVFAVMGLVIFSVVVVHFLISPIDVLWLRILRKFESFTG